MNETKTNRQVCGIRPTRWLSMMVLVAVVGMGRSPAQAASPHAGFYTGYVYSSISGTITVPESPIGAAGFTVDSSGNITGNMAGTVDSGGAITWNANATGFTTGMISGGVLTATTSQNNGGAITTFRIAASNSAGGFGGGGTVAQSLLWRWPSPSGALMRGVTYGGGQFVAVGAAGSVAISANGTNWVAVSSIASRQLNAVAHGNGMYVAVGDGATVISSPDALTWTARSLGSSPNQNFSGVAFGNGTFVAVNLVNEVFTSPDGSSWTKIVNSSVGPFWNKLKYVGGRFVLVGQSGSSARISTSADGVTWSTEKLLGSASGILDVVFGNSKWVGVSPSGYFSWTSADASDATTGAFSGLGDAVGFVNGTFVSDNRYYSTDGLTWKRDSYPNVDVNSMVAQNGLLVAVGSGITTTTNGTLWALHTKTLPLPTVNNVGVNGPLEGQFYDEVIVVTTASKGRSYRMGVGGIIDVRPNPNPGVLYTNVVSPTTNTLRAAFGHNGTGIAVGDNGTIVVYSSAMDAWTNVNSGTSVHLRSIAGPGSSTFVAVGTGGTILRTTNSGQTWNATASGTTSHLNRVNYLFGTGFGYYVAVGDNGVIRKSTDGATWTTLASGTTKRLVGIGTPPFGNVKLVAVADDSTVVVSEDHGTTWRTITVNAPLGITYSDGATARGVGGFEMSTDYGTNWTYTLPTIGLAGIGHGNGRFVVNASSARLSSTDLENWTVIPVPYPHNGIAYGNGILVSVGAGSSIDNKGFASTSVDGVKWTDRITPALGYANTLTKVIFAQGKFVTLGTSGTIFSSTDGVNWVNRTPALTASELRGVAFGNGVFAIIGANGILRNSSDGETWTTTGDSGATLNDLTFASGLFVAVGDNGAIRTSTNGINWTARTTTPNHTITLHSVRYVSGRFIAVGNVDAGGAVVVHSTDGISWTKEISNIAYPLRSAITANGNYVAIGDSGTLVSASFQDTDSPSITGQPAPASQTVNQGATVTYSATTAGASVQYRWLKDGTPLADGPGIFGAATAVLTLTGVDVLDAGVYQLSVWNDTGSQVSQPVTLTVTPPPTITQHPQPTVQAIGSGASLTVVATGTGPFTYVWKKAGVALVNGGNISGQGTASLNLSGLQAADAGFYTVEVSNTVGTSVSRVAGLSVHSLAAGAVQLALNPSFNANVPLIKSTVLRSGASTYSTNLVFASGVVQPDGKAVVVGTFEYYPNGGTQTNYSLIRLNTDGTRDTSFNPPLIEFLRGGSYYSAARLTDVALLSDGRIVVVGEVSRVGGTTTSRVVLLNANGTHATSFAPAGLNSLYSVAVDSQDRIVVAGSLPALSVGDGATHKHVSRLLASGAFDTTFNSGSLVAEEVHEDTLMIQPGDKIVLFAYTDVNYTISRPIRLLNNGTVDGTFASGSFAGSPVHDLQAAPAGGILAPGRYLTIGGTARKGMARLTDNGALDTTFGNPGALSTPQPTFYNAVGFANGVALLAGSFTNISGSSISNLALVNADGTFQASSTLGSGLDAQATLAFGSPDRNVLYVAGNFTNLNGVPVPRIFRLNAATGTGATLPLQITAFSPSQSVSPGSTVLLSVAATGTGSLSYQWRKNEVNLNGETAAQLLLSNIQAGQAGDYTVVVTDTSGSSPSAIATITVADPQTYAQWLVDKGLSTGVNDAPSQDPDNDGHANIVEFVLGTHPNQTGSISKPIPINVNDGGTDYPAVRYQRNKRATGVTLVVTASDVVTFGSILPTTMLPPVELGGNLEQITIRANPPFSPTTKMYFHIRITQP